ncbi:S-layer homology domain-containing protein [Candidatus Margulisiibacteriota bacterium]
MPIIKRKSRYKGLLLTVLSLTFACIIYGKVFANEYRHTLTPYFGYHIFHTNKNLANGFEAGLRGREILTPFLSVEGGVGIVVPYSVMEGSLPFEKTNKVYNVNLLLDVFKYNGFDLFISGGLAGLLEDLDNYDYVLGVGARLKIHKEWAVSSSLHYLKDVFGYIGLEKRIDWFSQKIISKKSQQPIKAMQVSFDVPSGMNIFAPKKISFADISNHWARNDIALLASQGILDAKTHKGEQNFFKPKDIITRADLARLVVIAAMHKELKNDEPAKIRFKISGEPTFLYVVNLKIFDNRGLPVKDLLTNKSLANGEYTIPWNGTDDQEDKVFEGTYTVKLNISHRDLAQKTRRKELTGIINVSVSNKLPLPAVPSELKLSDIPSDYGAKAFVYAAVKNNFIKPVTVSEKVVAKKTQRKSLYFAPAREVTKVEYLEVMGRLLYYFGAGPVVRADLTFYDNYKVIPSKVRPFLDIYVTQTGYGSSKLRPNNKITRAEAAAVLHKVFRWKWKLEANNIPIKHRKITPASLKKLNDSLGKIKYVKPPKKYRKKRKRKKQTTYKKRVKKKKRVAKKKPVKPKPKPKIIAKKTKPPADKTVDVVTDRFKKTGERGIKTLKSWRKKLFKKK